MQVKAGAGYMHARTGLVGAEDVHAGHLLDGGHARYDCALLGELVGAKREGDGEHGGHSDGDSTNNDYQHVGQRGAALCTCTPVLSQSEVILGS